MKKSLIPAGMAVVAVLAVASAASADFIGQPILGPITLGSSVTGNTVGHADDNDGWDSGKHIFDIWAGGDDVWQLNWAGGDMNLQLLYNPAPPVDLDMFLYEPGAYDSTGTYSIINTGVEEILYPAAPAGIYYINIDSPIGQEGAYTLNVLPEPTTLVLLALGACALHRRP